MVTDDMTLPSRTRWDQVPGGQQLLRHPQQPGQRQPLLLLLVVALGVAAPPLGLLVSLTSVVHRLLITVTSGRLNGGHKLILLEALLVFGRTAAHASLKLQLRTPAQPPPHILQSRLWIRHPPLPRPYTKLMVRQLLRRAPHLLPRQQHPQNPQMRKLAGVAFSDSDSTVLPHIVGILI